MEHLDDNQNEDTTPNTDQFDESLLGDSKATESIQPAENLETNLSDISFTNRIDLSELQDGIALIKGEISKVIVGQKG
ncbi:MAG: MoxR-like ATPase, partial [Psychroserpens sp.]